jgi:ParB family chromosome partitioning protein
MWAMHDRLESEISEETCKEEIESHLKHGQIVPVLGRPLRSDPLYDIELIYGARRLFVARHLNKQLAVELRDMPDREALVAMDIENRQRKDITPYERGMSYARWLRSKYFESQEEIAKVLHISPSQVSRLLKLAKLPSVIVNAFASPSDICERWGLELMEIWEDPQRRQAIAQQARAIGAIEPRPSARDVYRKLSACAVRGRRVKERSHDEVVMDDSGAPLFRIRRQARSIALLLPVERVSANCLEALREAVVEALHRSTPQGVDSVSRFPGKPASLERGALLSSPCLSE